MELENSSVIHQYTLYCFPNSISSFHVTILRYSLMIISQGPMTCDTAISCHGPVYLVKWNRKKRDNSYFFENYFTIVVGIQYFYLTKHRLMEQETK